KARAASVLATRDPGRAVAEMESVDGLAGEAHAELRAVIDGLAPPEIAAGGLAESLRRYALLAGKAHGVRVRFAADELPELGGPRRFTALRRRLCTTRCVIPVPPRCACRCARRASA